MVLRDGFYSQMAYFIFMYFFPGTDNLDLNEFVDSVLGFDAM